MEDGRVYSSNKDGLVTGIHPKTQKLLKGFVTVRRRRQLPERQWKNHSENTSETKVLSMVVDISPGWRHVSTLVSAIENGPSDRANAEAVDRYHRSIELNRNFPLAHLYLTVALEELGRLDEARAEARAASGNRAGP